ncbi:hypothetical protein [Flammeovirga pacifica]|uniref:Uncharacterized protein n=1 Tax=Flammeovirga pacifica TaxID=915059 RepID=A0A1S1YWQ0_FLAPC|nr:hypothetical protein [Flammeovirga pacifica]OHX65434.1 hypothetical protein NH26_03260 [Flammeovirga pacifica]
MCGNGQGYKALQLSQEFKSFGIFYPTFIFKDFNIFFLNAKGRDLKSKIKLSLDHYNTRLRSKDLTAKELKEILQDIGSNIFLLENFNADLIEKLNFKLSLGSNEKGALEHNFNFENIYDVMSPSLLMNMDIIESFSSSFDQNFLFESANHYSPLPSSDGYDSSDFDFGGDF